MQAGNAASPRPFNDLAGHHRMLDGRTSISSLYGGGIAVEASKLVKIEGIKQEVEPPAPLVIDVHADDESENANADEESEEEEDAISQYERKRLARVAQNAQFLQQLGVNQAKKNVRGSLASQKTVAKPTKRTREDGEAHATVARRSRRLAGEKEEFEMRENVREEAVVEPLVVPEDDPSVFQYSCSNGYLFDTTRIGLPLHGRQSGFQQRHSFADAYKDPRMVNSYHCVSISGFEKDGLIAAGGDFGRVSVFPAAPSVQPNGHVVNPSFSFLAQREGVSCVNLQSRMAHGKNLLFTTARHTGMVKLWDLNQPGDHRAPKQLMELRGVHSDTISGMDIQGNRVLTGSLDSTIALSTFSDRGSSLEVGRLYKNHYGFVKSVRFAPLRPATFASGGFDRVVRVYDTRSQEARASQQMKQAHSRGIYSVNWHPTQEHVLLTAGFDLEMHLFDLRHTSKPLAVMNAAHKKLYSAKKFARKQFHPLFVAGGEYVVSSCVAQEDRKISLHRTLDGKKISLGYVQNVTSCMAVDPATDRLLVAHRRNLQTYDFKLQDSAPE